MSELLTEIQPLLWPRPGICTDEAMYFRRDPNKTSFVNGRDAIEFELDGAVWFDTYFNAFSISKWKTYGVPSRLFLKIRYRGSFQVRLVGYQYRNAAVIPYTFDAVDVGSEEENEAVIELDPEQECIIYGFLLISMGKGSEFLGGAYCRDTNPSMLPEVKIALNICTYHRERYVLETLGRIKGELMDKPGSPLRGNMMVYVTDNGQTLKERIPDYTWLRLMSQNGYGSAGGFARGQLEIHRDEDRLGLTHMIFMDDDISLDPRVLIRTYWFLRSLKEEYRPYVLGGELLRLNFPFSQVEAGAQWNGGKISSTKPNLDLRRLDHVLFNEIPERMDYQGWWFCCVPLREDTGFPMPVYFHRDDVEFGLRCKGFIYLNGICVWHDEYENKPNPAMAYYDTRNRYIVNALHCPWYGGKSAAKDLVRDTVKRILTQRYYEAELTLRAARNFCAGPERTIGIDGQELYSQITGSADPVIPLAECESGMSIGDYEVNLFHVPPPTKWEKAKWWLKGFLLPAKFVRTVPMFMPSPDCFYRAKKVFHYDSSSETVLITKKSMKRAAALLTRLVVTCVTLVRQYPKASEKWRCGEEFYVTDRFWNEKLKIYEE